MERILIVAKTRMYSGICVSGLTRSSHKGIRLKPPDRLNQPLDTRFEVGQVWDIEFQADEDVEPPHVEDVTVLNQRYVTRIANMRDTLIRHIQPWRGGPENLFDGALTMDQRKCYISQSGQIPNCSTGYWITDRLLTLSQENDKPYYLIEYNDKERGKLYTRNLSIKFVGFTPPVRQIPPGTLIRVSLARWFLVSGEKRCYLQISGWYV